MVTRVFVGACEAFIQGAVFYLSFWYPYNELASRGAIYFSTSALAGAFNGLIAYAVQKDLQHVNSWMPWRWLFLIEGVVPIGWAFVLMVFLPSTPEDLKLVKRFFSEEERQLIQKRSRLAYNTGESKFQPKLMLRVLTDPKFWMLVCIECATLFCLTSLTNFLPSILHGFGWSTVKSQLMTVIIYACAFVTIILSARISDKTGKRGVVIITNAAIASLGYILLLTMKNPSGRFAGACECAFFPQVFSLLLTSPIHRHRRIGGLPQRRDQPYLVRLSQYRLHLPRHSDRSHQLHRASRRHLRKPGVRRPAILPQGPRRVSGNDGLSHGDGGSSDGLAEVGE